MKQNYKLTFSFWGHKHIIRFSCNNPGIASKAAQHDDSVLGVIYM